MMYRRQAFISVGFNHLGVVAFCCAIGQYYGRLQIS
jgi:hypothetical protein